MVYDWRVGTSICEMLKRASSTIIARGRLGMSGTIMRRILDGICVHTIVFTRPMRPATLAATSAERPARKFAPKKMLPSSAGSAPKRT